MMVIHASKLNKIVCCKFNLFNSLTYEGIKRLGQLKVSADANLEISRVIVCGKKGESCYWYFFLNDFKLRYMVVWQTVYLILRNDDF